MKTATMDMVRVTQNALNIPKLTHAEAGRLAETEIYRVVALVESLSGDDWSQPTDCTAWTVREMVAHLAGACAAYTSWGEFFRQMAFNPYIRTEDMPVDGINRRQVEDRVDKTTAELVDEFREIGPKAIRNRHRLPWIIRALRLPMGEPVGIAPLGYLLDTIYPRDQWMHRVDICRATGREIQLTLDHDGRMVALVLRELAEKLSHMPDQPAIDLHLTGEIEVSYHFGDGNTTDATITIDFIEFNRLASRRISPSTAWGLATITGDSDAARWFLENSEITY